MRTQIDLLGTRCPVAVHCVEHLDEGLAQYGVRFVNPDPSFVDLLLERAGAPREKVECYWNSAN